MAKETMFCPLIKGSCKENCAWVFTTMYYDNEGKLSPRRECIIHSLNSELIAINDLMLDDRKDDLYFKDFDHDTVGGTL